VLAAPAPGGTLHQHIMSPESLSETPTDADGTERDATDRTTRGPGSPAGTAPATAEADLDTDTLFELLQNQRRRDALRYLGANEGRTTLSDMAEHIAAKENDLPVGAINSKQRKRVYIGLYQCHLPKLADAGVVDFDKDRGTIELCDRAAQLYPYLDEGATASGPVADEQGAGPGTDSDSTGTDTFDGLPSVARVAPPALAGVGVAALAGVAGVPGAGLLSPTGWTVVCAVALLVATALPYRRG
jgi:hypothetical protein